MAFNVFVILRIIVGMFFVASGFEKLISPYQNFLYVVQGYEIFGAFLENVAAHSVPWVELILGVFLVFGLWLKWVLRAFIVLIAMFIGIVLQALIRHLPVTECGCFGDLISFPLPVVIIFDCVLLVITGFLLEKEPLTAAFSLDRYFSK